MTPKESFDERIRGMTELEALTALQIESIASTDLFQVCGDCPRTRSILEQYKVWKAQVENPDLYWDTVIRNLQTRLEKALANKSNRVLPPLART